MVIIASSQTYAFTILARAKRPFKLVIIFSYFILSI